MLKRLAIWYLKRSDVDVFTGSTREDNVFAILRSLDHEKRAHIALQIIDNNIDQQERKSVLYALACKWSTRTGGLKQNRRKPKVAEVSDGPAPYPAPPPLPAEEPNA